MSLRPHILVVNGRKVSGPVFVLGGPCSGTELIAGALRRSGMFHVTIGQPPLLGVAHAFGRSPSIRRGRDHAAAAVIRDGAAQSWLLTPVSCRACLPACQRLRPDAAAGAAEAVPGPCADERAITRFGDATPGLIYCAEALVAAFPDARPVQVVRDGRSVVADMLADPAELAWFSDGVANVKSEFPNPFYGIETEADLLTWPRLSLPAKCALRWRGAVHAMARLRAELDGERLTALRYEDMVADPERAGRQLGEFVGEKVPALRAPEAGRADWRQRLTAVQVAEIERVAGPQLRRLGY